MAERNKLTQQQTADFCRGLALQLHAGITIADALHLLAEDESGAVQQLYRRMGSELDQGRELAEVLEDSGCFPDYVWGMVRIGQETGKLEQTLQSLSNFYEQRSRSSRQIKNAISYPSMVFVLMLVVVTVLLVKVLPVFDGVYASLGSRLTGVAAGLLRLGQLLEMAMPAILGTLAVCGALALAYRKISAVREKVNRWYQLRFGDRGIGRKFNNARFSRAVAMGLSSGLTLEESMELAENLLKTVPGAAMRCHLCAQRLEAGAALPEAMKEAELLPPAESRMLAAGLRSGSGDRVMEAIAERLSRQAEEALEDLVAGIEPAMVLVASILVGTILLAVMLPLMNIMSAIG